MLIAAVIIAVVISLMQVLIAAITGVRGQELYDASMKAFESAMLTTLGFTATLGVLGVAVLWALRRRGPILWAVTGGVLGGAGGLLAGVSNNIEFLAAALFGWALFLTIRWRAGIKD